MQTNSEVIWELVMAEQAGLCGEKKKRLMFSEHFTSIPNFWPAVTISSAFWY